MTASIDQLIGRYLESDELSDRSAILDAGVDALPDLQTRLKRDQPIEELERAEEILKALIATLLSKGPDGSIARRLAAFQKDLGFLLKYKSYAIKATTPLGYSMFLQSPHEGFSFQRHVSHKIEIFHVVDTTPGAFVFLCTYPEWMRIYEETSFQRWLDGEPNRDLESFRRFVSAGDVFPITDLGTVHSAFGCILEEFATVSTDMVDRLHDQNRGRSIPELFTRSYAEARLRLAVSPSQSQVFLGGERVGRQLTKKRIPGGFELVLLDDVLRAARYEFESGADSFAQRDDHRATVLHVFSGGGEITIADVRELRNGQRPNLPFSAGDLFLIPRGLRIL